MSRCDIQLKSRMVECHRALRDYIKHEAEVPNQRKPIAMMIMAEDDVTAKTSGIGIRVVVNGWYITQRIMARTMGH